MILIKYIIIALGFILSRISFRNLELLANLLAKCFLVFAHNRKRTLYSNLSHAFPSWTHRKVKSIALKSTVSMIEMGFFSLCYPHFSGYQKRSSLLCPKALEGQLRKLREARKPTLLLVPHTSLFESIAITKLLHPPGDKTLGAIYRPHSNPIMDDWINQSRRDCGLSIFSRKKGLVQARRHLADGNWLALLFDQNAGLGGELSLFLNRLCSITPLPDIVIRGTDANILLSTVVRSSFFKGTLKIEELSIFSQEEISQKAHQKLEELILNHPEGLPEWLWSHGKWKTQDAPNQIFHLHSKRLNLPAEKDIPRNTRIWIRMPNWLGDLIMAIPLIRAIEKGRPDAEITLLCQSHYEPLLEYLKIGQRLIVLPPKGIGYFFFFWKLRKHYPDVHFLFTNSLRGDLEAYLCGAPLRLGGSTGRKRKLLSHQAIISEEFEEKHQTVLWEEYLKFFGLKVTISTNPIIEQNKKAKCDEHIVCLAPGSSNSPEKRWSTKNWIKLLKELNQNFPLFHFKLVGTSTDSKICSEIFNSVNSSKIENLAGKTDLFELCELLIRSKCLVCNDSGSMHLANLLGTQIVAIFNTTNPEITGPFFNAKKYIINRNSCTSEANFDELISCKVFDCLKEMNELTKNVIKAKN